jgi:hypothetical protein
MIEEMIQPFRTYSHGACPKCQCATARREFRAANDALPQRFRVMCRDCGYVFGYERPADYKPEPAWEPKQRWEWLGGICATREHVEQGYRRLYGYDAAKLDSRDIGGKVHIVRPLPPDAEVEAMSALADYVVSEPFGEWMKIGVCTEAWEEAFRKIDELRQRVLDAREGVK